MSAPAVGSRPAVVMDCGTGYTKLGFAGNVQPSFVLPTVLASGSGKPPKGLEDLGFLAGEEALAAAYGGATDLIYPVRHGMVDNWDHMEKFWQHCVFQQLRVDPGDHAFVLTEPPLNPPEARESLAEVMFEGLGCSGLYIGVQAVLALYASWALAGKQAGATATAGEKVRPHHHTPLTGCVVDAGDGVTHAIPVVDGYVLGSSAASMPVAGREVTAFVQQLLRERGEPVPPEISAEVAKRLKEEHCYCCADMVKEFGRFDAQPDKYFRTMNVQHPRNGTSVAIDVGYERFLGPEIFFNPEIYSASTWGGGAGGSGAGGGGSGAGLAGVGGGPGGSILASSWRTPLPRVVDSAIQSCPIDTRRALYGNLVLSGGTTMFKNFGRRLAADLTAITGSRLRPGATAVDINVHSHPLQRYAVWFGGSVLSCDAEFPKVLHTRAEYEEYGPSICRSNYVFRD